LQHLGQTRSAYRTNHLLQTPDTFVRSPLPGMQKAVAIVHTAPARGAQFAQYTVEFEAGGLLAPARSQRFVYVLDGDVETNGAKLSRGGYAYFPAGHAASIFANLPARAAIIEKEYQLLPAVAAPAYFTGRECDIPASSLNGDEGLLVRALIPEHPSFDFAVNLMTYAPGAALPMVEIHVMEHGLLMLEGGGIYRLGDDWYPVAAGDFIWMAPFCPQWFGAIGKTPAKYLIYKDWNRAPMANTG